MPTFENGESLSSVRTKINDGIQNAETAITRLNAQDVLILNHDNRIDALEVLGSGGVTDGDKGDIVVSGAGSIWTLDTTLASSLRDRATHTGTQSVSTIAGTKAQFDAAVSDGDFMYVGDAPTAHTHPLTSISDVTISATNLNTLDDGVNTTLHFHDADRARANHTGTQLSSTISDFNEAAQDAVGGMVDASLVYNDATPTLQRAALTGAVTASAGSNATSLGSFTKAQLDAAVSDGNVMYTGDAPTAHTHTLADISDVTITVANLNSLDDGVNNTLHFHDSDRSRANHTGTQTASTISDFSTAADARIAAASINALSDVVITTPSTGQVLKYDGANWINDTDGGVANYDGYTQMVPAAGNWVGNSADASALGTQAQVADRTVVAPFVPAYAMTIDQIALCVSTALADSNAKIVIFAADANGRPTTLLRETANISTAATGTWGAVLTPLALTAGTTYWIGVRASGTFTLRTLAAGALPALDYTVAATPVGRQTLTRSETFANAAVNWTYVAGNHSTAAMPLILMRVA